MTGSTSLYPFDLFRPVFWGNEDVDYWYRQNVFLYVRKGSVAWQLMMNSGHRSMTDIGFMNCIHPDALHFRRYVAALFPSFIQAVRKRLSGRSGDDQSEMGSK